MGAARGIRHPQGTKRQVPGDGPRRVVIMWQGTAKSADMAGCHQGQTPRATTSLPCPGASQGCCGDGQEKRLLLAQGWHPLEGTLRGTVHGLWRLLRMEAWHHLSRSHGLKKLCFHVSTAMTVESLAYSKLFSGRTHHWYLWQIYYAHRPVLRSPRALRPGCRHGSRPESGCRGQHRSSVAGSRVDSSLPGRIQNTNTP